MVDVNNIAGNAINVIIIIGMLIGFIALAATLIFFYLRKKKYSSYKVVIYERDALGNVRTTYDDAGIFVDRKTKNKLLYLKKNKNVAMNPDDIPGVTHNKDSKTVYLYRTGLKNYRYLKPVISQEELNYTVGEEDVNWAINIYEKQKNSLMQDRLMQLVPFMVLAVVSIVILVMFMYFFRSFDSLQALGESMTEAANAIRDANSGVTILQ